MDDETCLVVGIDASPESLAAVEWAMRLAGDLRRPVLAVHAVGLLEGQHLRPHPDVAASSSSSAAAGSVKLLQDLTYVCSISRAACTAPVRPRC
jgi:nucleotide-binding universal stress UspA family protein